MNHFTSIVILNYNTLECTKLCIESIRKYTQAGTYEIILIDNASTDGSVEWIQAQTDIRAIFNEENLGFPKGCNQGMKLAKGDSILLLNSDVVVTPLWLEQMLEGLYFDEQVGAVGCVTNQCSWLQKINVPYSTSPLNLAELHRFADGFNHVDYTKWHRTRRLVGFCFLFKREVMEKIGYLEEVFSPGNYEDDDYSLRIWEAGYAMLLLRDTFVHHFGSVSFRTMTLSPEEQKRRYNALMERNQRIFHEKWGIAQGAYDRSTRLLQFLPEAFGTQEPRILVLGCRCGMDLFEIEEQYCDAILVGVAEMVREAEIVSWSHRVYYRENCYKNLPMEENFDCIVCVRSFRAEVGERVEDLLKILKPEGKIFYWEDDKPHLMTR